MMEEEEEIDRKRHIIEERGDTVERGKMMTEESGREVDKES